MRVRALSNTCCLFDVRTKNDAEEKHKLPVLERVKRLVRKFMKERDATDNRRTRTYARACLSRSALIGPLVCLSSAREAEADLESDPGCFTHRPDSPRTDFHGETLSRIGRVEKKRRNGIKEEEEK